MKGTSHTERHRTLAVIAGLNAAAAWLGAVGLASGVLALGGELDARLPLDSPVLAGAALAGLVAVPLTLLAVAAWSGAPRTRDAATLVGLVLIGWIAIQLAFLRTLSFFHPFYVGVGAALAVWGRRAGTSAAAGARS